MYIYIYIAATSPRTRVAAPCKTPKCAPARRFFFLLYTLKSRVE